MYSVRKHELPISSSFPCGLLYRVRGMRSKVTFIFHVEFNLPIASYHITRCLVYARQMGDFYTHLIFRAISEVEDHPHFQRRKNEVSLSRSCSIRKESQGSIECLFYHSLFSSHNPILPSLNYPCRCF